MILPFRIVLILIALVTGLATSYSVFADEEVYDRLDGTGPSHKRVDVIEWEGNLEVHVYPKASTQGLGAKLDDREKGKKVMVIGYHFKGSERLVRRAILGVPFTANVKGFIDPTEKDFDKLALSNQTLGAPWVPYKLEPAPKQWYPDGDERNNDATPAAPIQMGETKAIPLERAPASATSDSAPVVNKSTPTRKVVAPKSEPVESDDTSLNHYNW